MAQEQKRTRPSMSSWDYAGGGYDMITMIWVEVRYCSAYSWRVPWGDSDNDDFDAILINTETETRFVTDTAERLRDDVCGSAAGDDDDDVVLTSERRASAVRDRGGGWRPEPRAARSTTRCLLTSASDDDDDAVLTSDRRASAARARRGGWQPAPPSTQATMSCLLYDLQW